jgi:beta-xylosidase
VAAALASPAAAGSAPPSGPLFEPLLARDFPDPFVLPDRDRFVAYATNSSEANVQVALSDDLRNWSLAPDPQKPSRPRDALPTLPPWAKKGSTWAPEVLKNGDLYLLYFTARDRDSGLQCVGVAVAADALGPFAAQGDAPLVCQRELGGTIDASPFRDADGGLYLYFKNDGNNPAADKPVDIWGQRLSSDGLSLVGTAVPLRLRADAPWEGRLIEAPTMVRGPGGYVMLFSANDYAWQESQRLSAYAIGAASCDGPLGPCRDAPGNPLLHSFNDREVGCLSGPGHQAVFEVAGRAFLAFHAWAATPGCRQLDPRRYFYVVPLLWEGGMPRVARGLRPADGK